MPPISAAYQAHQRKRWIRPDAYRFIRPDWRRFVRPADRDGHPFALYERKYRPDQLRDDVGRWADEGLKKPTRSAAKEPATTELSAASRKGGDGHHYVPRAVVRNSGISDEAKEVFEKRTTGPLIETRSNQWDQAHRDYNKAVGEALDQYLKQNETDPGKMTAAQAREFLGKIFESPDPRIRNYNMGIQMREIMQRLLRRGGRE